MDRPRRQPQRERQNLQPRSKVHPRRECVRLGIQINQRPIQRQREPPARRASGVEDDPRVDRLPLACPRRHRDALDTHHPRSVIVDNRNIDGDPGREERGSRRRQASRSLVPVRHEQDATRGVGWNKRPRHINTLAQVARVNTPDAANLHPRRHRAGQRLHKRVTRNRHKSEAILVRTPLERCREKVISRPTLAAGNRLAHVHDRDNSDRVRTPPNPRLSQRDTQQRNHDAPDQKMHRAPGQTPSRQTPTRDPPGCEAQRRNQQQPRGMIKGRPDRRARPPCTRPRHTRAGSHL